MDQSMISLDSRRRIYASRDITELNHSVQDRSIGFLTKIKGESKLKEKKPDRVTEAYGSMPINYKQKSEKKVEHSPIQVFDEVEPEFVDRNTSSEEVEHEEIQHQMETPVKEQDIDLNPDSLHIEGIE